MLQNLFGLKAWAKSKMNQIIRDERGEVNIVAIVILIGIAVVLAIVFKDAISDLNWLESAEGEFEQEYKFAAQSDYQKERRKN